jgi:hypothetical protein
LQVVGTAVFAKLLSIYLCGGGTEKLERFFKVLFPCGASSKDDVPENVKI